MTPEDRTGDATLLRVDSCCPYCAAATRMRITEAARDHMRSTPPDEQIGTYKCGRCGEGYPITAGAYQRATE